MGFVSKQISRAEAQSLMKNIKYPARGPEGTKLL